MALLKKLKNSYYKLRILSIDIVLGALSCGIMAVEILDVQMQIAWWFVLAFAVWIIYTTDHIIDSQKLKDNAFSELRYYYYKNFRIILTIEIMLIVFTILISFLFLDKKTIWFGIGLGIFVVVYLILIQTKGSEKSLWLQKELIVAIVYTVGIWGGPVLYSLQNINLQEVFIIISFFLIVWADILIIARFEIKNDEQDGFTSLPLIIGKKMSAWLINTLLFVSVFILLVLIFKQNIDGADALACIILLVISFTLLLLLKYNIFFNKNERYRILAESVFFLPALMLFV